MGCILFFASCKPHKIDDVDTVVINDSTMLDLNRYAIKKIYVGTHISNKPLSSQLVYVDGKEKYLLMDNGYIYQFDWDNGILEDSIATYQCGLLNNFSGFAYLNKDSLLVYNNSSNQLFVINGNGDVLRKVKVPITKTEEDLKPAVEGLNASRPMRQSDNILLSGTMLGNLVQAGDIKIPVSEYMNMQTGEWKTKVYYPKKYTQYNWGSYYLNRIYLAQDSNGHFLYSFPVCKNILKYNSDFTSCDTLLMRSRYDKGITECKLTDRDFDEDPSKEIRYYISQLSYSHILYDAYRNLYLRFVEHELSNWSGKGSFSKPVSVIVSDTDGHILSESKIMTPIQKVYYNNMHISSKGLAFAFENSDDSHIYFALVSIEKK